MYKSVPSVSSNRSSVFPLESTWIEINSQVFRKNLRLLKDFLKEVRLCLPIKANAYGHGLIEIAQLACQEGVDYLAVSSVLEGIQLRKAGLLDIPILVLGAFQDHQIQSLLDYHLEFSISSFYKAYQVAQILKEQDKKAIVHLEIETGMNRTGSRPETSEALYQYLIDEPCFEVKGVFSHLAMSDQPEHPLTKRQVALFDSWIRKCPKSHLFHLANSWATLSMPESHYSMVRPGLLCFGLCPQLKHPWSLFESCLTLKSRVSYFKVIQKGESVGYGASYFSKKQTRIATVAIGYGDGYRRALSNQAHVLIRGRRYPVVGQICMDQLMVDLGEGQAYVGDEVVLVGKQGLEQITIEELAQLCQTIPYEILTGLNERVPRYFI